MDSSILDEILADIAVEIAKLAYKKYKNEYEKNGMKKVLKNLKNGMVKK